MLSFRAVLVLNFVLANYRKWLPLKNNNNKKKGSTSSYF